jgi:curved DNA-binding protein CbpA
MADQIDPYKILQVDAEAEDEVIQAAYRRLARKYHPDLATTPGAEARMAAINAAWELIGDPAERQAFDRARTPLQHARAQPASPDDEGANARSSTGRAPAAQPSGPPPRPEPSRSRPSSRPNTPPAQEPHETVSRDWTSGRSTQGGGFDESMRAAEGFGAAGPPPGRPSGTVLNFGRYAGWSLGEVARADIEYIEWLDRAPIGRNYRQEVDEILRASGRRKSAAADATDRRGLYRRR